MSYDPTEQHTDALDEMIRACIAQDVFIDGGEQRGYTLKQVRAATDEQWEEADEDEHNEMRAAYKPIYDAVAVTVINTVARRLCDAHADGEIGGYEDDACPGCIAQGYTSDHR